MNDASYAVAFSRTTDALIETIGLDTAYREREQRSIYTLENHLCYLREARLCEALYVTTQLLEHDAKRLRVFHVLYRQQEDAPMATSEQMLLHVDSAIPKAAPFDTEVAERLRQLAHAHDTLPWPERAGRAIMTISS
jgi:acyl-CoA thioester hydrolase